MLWTDGSKVFGSHRRTCEMHNQRKDAGGVPDASVKHGGGNVMVWGCFGGGKVGDLYKVKGILNKVGYHSILQCHAISCGQRLFGANFLLQQDTDPKHTSKLCKNYLGKKQSVGILSVMEWPDLNPIELLWEQLDRMVRKKCPSSQSNLSEVLQEAWGKMSSDYLSKLTARMPKVCKAANGQLFDESKVWRTKSLFLTMSMSLLYFLFILQQILIKVWVFMENIKLSGWPKLLNGSVYSVFIQSALQLMPLIHPFTHTDSDRLPCKTPNSLVVGCLAKGHSDTPRAGIELATFQLPDDCSYLVT